MVLPLELEIPSLVVSMEGIIDGEEQRQSRLRQLESLHEKRIHDLEYLRAYQKITKMTFAKKIRPREL